MINKADIEQVKSDVRNIEFQPDSKSQAKVSIWGNNPQDIVFLYTREDRNGKVGLVTKYYDDIWEEEEYIFRIGTAKYLAELKVQLKRFVESVDRNCKD